MPLQRDCPSLLAFSVHAAEAVMEDTEFLPSCWGHRLRGQELIDHYVKETARLSEKTRVRLGAQKDIRFGKHPRECLDLYYGDRQPDECRSTLLFWHGGYWVEGDRQSHALVADAFVEAGMAVAVAGYPLAPSATLDQIVESATRCARHVLALRPGPLVLAGHSAGAHLAAMVATRLHGESRLRSLLLLSPVLDVVALLGSSVARDAAISADQAMRNSPLQLVDELPTHLHIVFSPSFTAASSWHCGPTFAKLAKTKEVTPSEFNMATVSALESSERPRGLRNDDHHPAPCYLLGPLRPSTRLVTTGWQRRDSAHAKSQQARASIGIVSAEIMAAECDDDELSECLELIDEHERRKAEERNEKLIREAEERDLERKRLEIELLKARGSSEEGMLASRAGAFLQFWTTLPEAADHQGARGLLQSRIEVSTASAHQHCLHRPLPTKVDDLRTSRSRPAAGGSCYKAVTKTLGRMPPSVPSRHLGHSVCGGGLSPAPALFVSAVRFACGAVATGGPLWNVRKAGCVLQEGLP
ncbi:hypothetical protein HPB51_010736 [Rhipicephalus microplus]|uniref:Alpha/beta hydrolase fold-3 domain-containing protein n=1 Tax=Rhipicephalus microplus TaxID=6941 RepID=A0A9J6DUD7_RHIMP|nr:hypothetical protein HPB51_010736 [Rhipicephalus microplus]